MNEKEAKHVILQAIEIAQKAGAYTIKDSALIFQAMLVLGINVNGNAEENGENPQPQDKTEK